MDLGAKQLVLKYLKLKPSAVVYHWAVKSFTDWRLYAQLVRNGGLATDDDGPGGDRASVFGGRKPVELSDAEKDKPMPLRWDPLPRQDDLLN